MFLALRTHFEVFGLEPQVLGLEACKSSKMSALFFDWLKRKLTKQKTT